MKKRIAVIVLALAITVAPAIAQLFPALPVIDVANLAQAIDSLAELTLQYEQLVATYNQIVLEYKHMLFMAQTLPSLGSYRFVPAV